MTNIQRAIDKQAKMESAVRDPVRYPLSNDKYIAHLRNQAKLARAVIEAVKAYESEVTNPVKDHVMCRHRQREMFAAMAAWADHVNGDDV